MGKVEKLIVGSTEVLCVDYHGCNQDEMMDVLERAKSWILTNGKPVLLLCEFHEGNRITPRFMRQLERDYKEVEDLIVKNAVLGLSSIQLWILKGMNLWTKRKIIHFDTWDAAVKFLVE